MRLPFALIALLACASLAGAQETPKEGSSAAAVSGSAPTRPAGRDTAPPNPLPPPVTTTHTLTLPGRTLHFTATAGAIRINNAQSGEAMAEVGYVAFRLDGGDPRTRPVTVAINGGPGAGSAWLDLGAMGPWRLPLQGAVSPSAPPSVVDNAETWLDFTDLVFLDPPGTGYGRILAKGDEVRKQLYSVDGDSQMLSVAIRKWLSENKRLESPKYIVGESYGGFRAPKLAHRLQDVEGIGVRGLVMISPLLDLGWFDAPNNPLIAVSHLPSLVAAARNLSGPNGRAELAEVEAYASGAYLTDLLHAESDPKALDRIVEKVAAFSGLDPAFVRRLGGRIDMYSFARERGRAKGQIGSLYDGRVFAYDPEPHASTPGEYTDAVIDAAKTSLASAMADVTATKLNWPIDARYEILNDTVSHQWNWGDKTKSQALSDLKRVLAGDAALHVLVVHGLTDQVTPYFASKLLLDQIAPMGDPGRVKLVVYGGGHMVYADDGSRAALREEARKLIEGR